MPKDSYYIKLEQLREKCPECYGEGELIDEGGCHNMCNVCNGEGYILHPERLVVLDEDQDVPKHPERDNLFTKYGGYLEAQQDMLKANWRKIKE